MFVVRLRTVKRDPSGNSSFKKNAFYHLEVSEKKKKTQAGALD
jgi:hypothetical protein